ncbi:four-helix bundle copper-binding protein [Ralstonia mannitolilytica]|uniref:four-helix bundle copper-binding protein n=1 Tax=Ralstonia mannitolilytica TaxID=105219 RepID=UPI0009EEDFCD|nr:four-helix bundle copper-binding protein [Ralstonia mannitolilytica]CAJ0687054.1 putative cysteine-rich protein YhjQ [Ralstonia mannitolilytica]CAJ0804599.1 putative cysteine-rich protein YhjQ [Ralstonia mannitolilytica]
MPHQNYQQCIDACAACHVECLHCAASCLAEQNISELTTCIRLDLDCADICSTAVDAMSRGSTYVNEVCRLCADICDACAAECAKHGHEHCQSCAHACQKCAQACRTMQ